MKMPCGRAPESSGARQIFFGTRGGKGGAGNKGTGRKERGRRVLRQSGTQRRREKEFVFSVKYFIIPGD